MFFLERQFYLVYNIDLVDEAWQEVLSVYINEFFHMCVYVCVCACLHAQLLSF